MDAEKRLRSRGYRLTPQRRAIVKALSEGRSGPLSAVEVRELAARRIPGTGLATAYRTLKTLTDLGVALPVHLHGESRHYEMHDGEHRHHLVCVSCGEALPFRGCDPIKLAERVRDESDFLMTSHCLSLFGYCGSCRPPAPGRWGTFCGLGEVMKNEKYFQKA